MKFTKRIAYIIAKYLKNQESAQEREELYSWFDRYTIATHKDQTRIDQLSREVKERLYASTGVRTVRKRRTHVLWLAAGAAAAVLISVLFLGYYLLVQQEIVEATPSELAGISAGKNQAIIKLSDGRMVNIDTLPINKPLVFGEVVLTKQADGQLKYESKEGHSPIMALNTMITPLRGQYTLQLSDGTKVHLNSSSTLTYPNRFEYGKDRVVELEGEGYFEVAKTANHDRFLVKSRDQVIEVLGTKFNVNAYSDGAYVKTTLAEGSVRVNPKDVKLTALTLRPDEQAVLGKNSLDKKAVNAENIIGWTQGFFSFEGDNSYEVLTQIERWYGIQVEGKSKMNATYSGKIPRNINLAQLVQLLDYADIPIRAVKQGEKYKLIIN